MIGRHNLLGDGVELRALFGLDLGIENVEILILHLAGSQRGQQHQSNQGQDGFPLHRSLLSFIENLLKTFRASQRYS